MSSDSRAILGRNVGHIRVTDLLGEGGMGAVYAGYDETLDRKVALKAIRGDFRINPDSKARFLREARILSKLDHPGVCRVHDFVSDDESDYLVIELVEGVNLRQAMAAGLDDREKRSIARQLLEVLVEVHARGIMHRDLKPENIMVTPQGDIKILDFGLSRLSEDEIALRTTAALLSGTERPPEPEPVDSGESSYVETKLGSILGTAGYMSPEQARGEPATPVSDMYSTGLILQELFTGKRPYDEGLTASQLLEKAAKGETNPVEGLPADLTNLINRFKSFAPGARPSSVDALQQLEWIFDTPRRRRRRAAVIAAGVVLTLLCAALGWQWFRAERNGRAAEASALEAQEQAEKAERVVEALSEVFQVTSPNPDQGQVVDVRDLLERGSAFLADRLEDDPEVLARVQHTIAGMYINLQESGRAVALLESVLRLRTEKTPEDICSIAFIEAELGLFYETADRLVEATESFKRALELVDRCDRPDRQITVFHWVAMHEMDLGNQERAEELVDLAASRLDEAIAANKIDLSDPDIAVINLLLNRSSIRKYREDYNGAARDAELALDLSKRGDFELFPPLLGLGTIYLEAGRYQDAKGAYRAILDELATMEDWEPIVPLMTLTAKDGLARCCRHLGQDDEAETLFREVIESYGSMFGPGYVGIAATAFELASMYFDVGRYGDALVQLQTTIQVLENEDSEWARETRRDSLEKLVTVSEHLGQHDAAREYAAQLAEAEAENRKEEGAANAR
jgi:tetratricopeptide (TPR) repeat protein